MNREGCHKVTPQACAKDTVFISYAHESPAFRENVKALADWLAKNGIMVVSDHQHEIVPPPVGWPTWMQQEIEDAAVVLAVCSPLYKARFEKRAEPDKGKGVTWEGAIITQDLYNSAVRNNKFFPILPDGGKHDDVPKVLRPFHNDHRFPSKNAGILLLIQKVLADRAVAATTVGPVPFAPVPAAPTTTPVTSSALRPVWNVPHDKNLNFTGREALLSALEQGLAAGKPAALTQALAGLGGVGKTQTAVEYAWRHKADYQIVWWLRSEQTTTLAADFAALAKPLDLKEKDAQDQTAIIDAVRRWLEHHPGWLLIFDNAVDKKHVAPYLPQGAAGHVLITTRSQVWQGVAAALSVKTWERTESVAFLEQFKTAKDPAGADAVAHALGDLPLALAQAAAYMDETVTSYADYLNLFNTRRAALWGQQPPPDSYPDTVGTTWTLSMEGAAKAAPGAAELMNLCAYLAPDDIPRDMLRDGSEHVPEPLRTVLSDPLRMNAVVAALRRYSLLEVRDDAFDMHRLVQAVVQDRLDPDARKTWCEAAARVVNDAYPPECDDVTSWAVCARLTPHARVVTDQTEKTGIVQAEVGRLLNQVGCYLMGRAEFGEAKEFFERALLIAKAVHEPTHLVVAKTLNNLGSVLCELGDFKEAIPPYRQALKIGLLTDGRRHPETAVRISNLGLAWQKCGAFVKAEKFFGQALEILETEYCPDKTKVATVLNNLGNLFLERGDLAKVRKQLAEARQFFARARTLLMRALEIEEAELGPDHQRLVVVLSNLGRTLQNMGDLKGARGSFERARKIVESKYGLDHLNVAIVLNNLGDVLRQLDDRAGARELFERALAIARVRLGESHPTTATFAKNLADLDK